MVVCLHWEQCLPEGRNVQRRIFLTIGGHRFLSNTSAGNVWVFIGLPFAHQKAAGYEWDVQGAGGSFLNSQTARVSTRTIQHSYNSAFIQFSSRTIQHVYDSTLIIWSKISYLEQDTDYWSSLITLLYFTPITGSLSLWYLSYFYCIK